MNTISGNSTSAKQLASYTGEQNIEYPETSAGPDLFIIFTTDLRNSNDGFNISYSTVTSNA